MEQAIKELQQKARESAAEQQEQALAQLEQMKAQLEEILRQLREEERKLLLTLLEARFQRMLDRQLAINDDTLKLAEVPETQWEDRHDTRSTQVSRLQAENVTDADKALVLLKEEGSSVAFPEAVEQMRTNMQTVVTRLQRSDVGETTQLLEQIIVEGLEEMLFSLQREIEKQSDPNQQQEQQQQQQPGDRPLVDQLAELKMIRSLQNQVNRLTRQFGLQIEGDRATQGEDLQFLQDLAGRQQRIQEATYDLSVGRNR